MSIDEFLTKFVDQVRSDDQWLVRCPGHDDNKASLAVREGADGRIVLFCHAGCSFDRVVEAMHLNTSDLFMKPSANGNGKREVAAYDYRAANGQQLYQSVRYEPKDFRQRRPDRAGGWIWNLRGVDRVVYRLPDLAGRDAIAIVEGEKDVDACWKIGIPATCNVSGAGKWKDAYAEQLKAAGVQRVRIIPDNDQVGRDHAEQVAQSCVKAGIEPRIVRLPEVPEKGDVSDYLMTHTKADLVALLKNAPVYFWATRATAIDQTSAADDLYVPVDVDDDGECDLRGDDDGKSKRGPSQATRIVELVCESGADLWASKPGEPYISIAVGEHREHYPLKSSTAKDYVSRIYYINTGRAPNASSLADALSTLSGKARFDGEPRDVYVRVANVADRIYLDLGDPSWRAVEICAQGWRVVTVPPISFRRPRGLLPLPEPQRGGSLQELRPFLNIASDDDFVLMVMWVLAAMRGVGPFPIKTFMAEQGAAKTTTTRALRRLFDPNESDVRRPPRNTEDLMIAASNGHVVAFDNLSTLSSELSDNLAVLSTGGGFAVRKLYENTEEVIFNAQKPIILNGISQVATRGDLLERAIVVTLPPIPEDKRKDEATFWREYEQAHPRILGALLDAVVVGLQRVQHVRLERKPRMADFAIWGVAVEPACPWPAGTFLDVYANNRQGAVEAMLEGDPVADAVRIMAPWKGTSGEFLQKLNEVVPVHITSRKDWFTRSRAATDALRRLGPALRRIGIEVKVPEKDVKRQADGRFYVIDKTVSATSCPSSASSDSELRAKGNDASDDARGPGSSPTSSENPNKNGADDTHDAHDTQETCSQEASWLDLK